VTWTGERQSERSSSPFRAWISLPARLLTRHIPVHSKKSVLCMKTAYIGCHETDFHFEVAICIALGSCPVCNETHNALRSNPSSIDSCGIIAVPGGARLRRLVDTGDAGRQLVGWR